MPVTEDGGYRPVWRVYRLEFGDDYPDEDLRGLVVRVRSTSIGKVLGIDAAAAADPLQPFRELAQCLVEWNVRDDNGEPVPTDFAGLMSQPEDFVLLLLREWQRALTEVSPPLGKASSGTGNGAPPPAPPMPIPMQVADRVS